ncbi:SAFB-like transcription modulator isoform X1 [Adelges cooleyi]|uniref:SAFB-like transcription modulator isoform X1 n=1 Tax=Adelges cooleyi TaxID=133065 RepID=UPI00217FF6DF|nr:SAFB-like transcription modulator isoform X1 [Adelges cooleyi]
MFNQQQNGSGRKSIWTGTLQWLEKSKSINDVQTITRSMPCTVLASLKNGEPELKAETWPEILILQLIPKHLLGIDIVGTHLKNSKPVFFQPSPCDSLGSLTTLMSNGYVGCVHFNCATTSHNCDFKIFIICYSPDKKAFVGFIPNDQTAFLDVLRERIQHKKASSVMLDQEEALVDEGNDPESYLFDKCEQKINDKSLAAESNLKSPGLEKKDSKTIGMSEKKTTPTKTVKTNVVGRRPGPKSKTCVPVVKIEKIDPQKKKNEETKMDQVDTSNITLISNEESKLPNEVITNEKVSDSNEVEDKESNNDIEISNQVESVNELKRETELANVSNNKDVEVEDNNSTNLSEVLKEEEDKLKCGNNPEEELKNKSLDSDENKVAEDINNEQNSNEKSEIKSNGIDDEDYIQDEELDHEADEEDIKSRTDVFDQIDDLEKCIQETNKDDNNEDSINLTIGDDDIKLFADEEDTNIAKEDEVNENQTKEEAALSPSKVRESRRPTTAISSSSSSNKNITTNNSSSNSNNTSRTPAASAKLRRSATDKRSSVGEKPRSSHKDDNKDNSNVKPSASVVNDEKKEEEKQIKDKVDAGNKQSNDAKLQTASSDSSKKNATSSLVRNIWVSGLSSVTKATDLKQLFSKYGKVVGAKVVTNAKTPGARCYGFVTLSSAEDANRSIEHLHQTELHGRIISVERAKRDNGYQQSIKNTDNSKENNSSDAERKNKKPDEKKEKKDEKREKRPEITIDDGDKKTDVLQDKKRSLSKDRSQDSKRSRIVIDKPDSRSRDRSVKSKSNERDRERLRDLERERDRIEREKKRQQEMLNYAKIKTERERQKQKEHEKALREEERRRRIEKERQMEIERKQKEESIRLEKERQKLRIERERIEKEKAELLRLERENQRLERERLQREKEELRRAQEKLEETKRQAALKRAMPPSPPPPIKRHSSSSSSRYDDRKEPPVRNSRGPPPAEYISPAAPPPPNITSSRHRYESHSESRRTRPSPPPPPPPASRPKDSAVSMRYGAPPPSEHHYRSRDDRSDRRDDSRRKESSSRHGHTSYDSSKSSYGMSRSSDNSTWPTPPIKGSFSSLGSSSGSSSMTIGTRPDPWSTSSNREMETAVWQRPPQPPSDNRWNTTSSNPSSMSSISGGRSSGSNSMYVNNHQVLPPNIGMNISTGYTDNRFDNYKMSSMSRKY